MQLHIVWILMQRENKTRIWKRIDGKIHVLKKANNVKIEEMKKKQDSGVSFQNGNNEKKTTKISRTE